jgi:hypothetical protein
MSEITSSDSNIRELIERDLTKIKIEFPRIVDESRYITYLHYEKLTITDINKSPLKCKLCKAEGNWNDITKMQAHYLGCLRSDTIIPNVDPVCHYSISIEIIKGYP